MTISHSCCPGKTNIVAPVFRMDDRRTMKVSKGRELQFWECEGCRTVIYFDIEPADTDQMVDHQGTQ